MKNVFIIISFFSSLLSFSQTINDLKGELYKWHYDKDLTNASISFFAYNLDSNKIIANYDENRVLVPASTMKLVTTSTVLELLGKNKRFKTTIQYTGKIDSNAVLNGNIYIKGGGDPSLGSKRFANYYGDFMHQWAKAIINLGIDSINGSVIADATIFNKETIPATWIWGDLGNYYGAGAYGLSIYENIYTIELESGRNKGDSTRIKSITPYIPNLKLQNNVKSMLTNKDNSYILGAPYQNKRTITGGIPLNRTKFSVKGSIPDPPLLAAYQLNSALKNLGVKVANSPSTIRLQRSNSLFNNEKRVKIMTTYSPTLISLIQQTNTYSINLYAEHFMDMIGLNKYKSADTESGTLATINFLKSKGIDISGLSIYDGSGLSRFNAISSKQLVMILNNMYQSANFKIFKKTLPIAGKTGTLKNIGKGTVAQGNVFAKSGYMTKVRSYAGYVKTQNKKNIAFALIVNNYNCTASQMKRKMEKIIIKLAEINN